MDFSGKKFTLGYIAHDPVVHTKYLGPSLLKLHGEYDELLTNSLRCSAVNYNWMLDQCKTDYLILTHQDVSFPADLLERIEATITRVPDFGALGLVGVDHDRQYYQVSPTRVNRVETLDCCFIVIRKDLDLRFDADTFDEYHQYVEDYCGQVTRRLGRSIYTILADPATFVHHGATYSQRGSCWGRWSEYHRHLQTKWPGLKTT
jgi:hypothetical protein